MMSIGRSSRRENLLGSRVLEPMFVIRTRLANHIRASSRDKGCTNRPDTSMDSPARASEIRSGTINCCSHLSGLERP